MFEIGFSELIVIGVVALLVIGPERLPKVARMAGHLYGRMQRYVSSVKSDISQEIQLDEIRRAGQSFKNSIESTVSGVEQQATVVDDYLRGEIDQIEKGATTLEPAESTRSTNDIKVKPGSAEPVLQQRLPLDEPDQNVVAHMPPPDVESARGVTPEKTA
jgi:sec-independent protein translocase protein TatB